VMIAGEIFAAPVLRCTAGKAWARNKHDEEDQTHHSIHNSIHNRLIG
jgi:hypothetical protein